MGHKLKGEVNAFDWLLVPKGLIQSNNYTRLEFVLFVNNSIVILTIPARPGVRTQAFVPTGSIEMSGTHVIIKKNIGGMQLKYYVLFEE